MGVCKIEGCRTKTNAKGMCQSHYFRWWKYGDPLPKPKIKDHPLKSCWVSMKQRCYHQSNIGYKNYGGRGIKVCDRWLEPKIGFWNFVEDMGDKPSPRHSIDRIDNDGDYSPENCRWATDLEQANNRRLASKPQVNNTSGYRNVSYSKNVKKWVSYSRRLRDDKKVVIVGYFDSPEEAYQEMLKEEIKRGFFYG